MEIKITFKILTLMLLTAIFTVSATPELHAKEMATTKLKEFQIVIEKTAGGIKITCQNGCTWKELSFSMNSYKPQVIDKYGITELNKDSSPKESNLTDFLLTITKTKKGFKLEGIKGTAWTNLTFSLAEKDKQSINQLGMIN